MFSIFKKKEITINVTDNGIYINKEKIDFPFHLETLEKLLGRTRIVKAEERTLYLWDKLGIKAYSDNKIVATVLEIHYKQKPYKHYPEKAFLGKLSINGEVATTYRKNNINKLVCRYKGDDDGSFVFNDIFCGIGIDYDTKEIDVISLSEFDGKSIKMIWQQNENTLLTLIQNMIT